VELSDIQRHLRNQLGLEIEPGMSAYIHQMIHPTDPQRMPAAQIPVIGADARTGVAVRRLIPAESFLAVQP
jgi:hypothetical protein